MPNWSYIPYTYPSYHVSIAFHPAMTQAASRRIRNYLYGEFKVSEDKMYFLQRIMDGVLNNGYGRRAYIIVLEAFGKPLLVMRNLAHTLQNPKDRKVYIVHLEEALHVWRERETTVWWECVAVLGLTGIMGAITAVGFQCVPWPTLKPHALLSFFH